MPESPRLVGVACSGGPDSLALLHATARAARPLGVSVAALHVQHGLQPEAEAWWRRLQRQCRGWRARGLPVQAHVHRLQGRPAPGDSVEAWAREARHAALLQMAQTLGIDLVLLAHHARDQAETVLLQLLRGSGAAGLAAMPAQRFNGGVCFARPWLAQSAEAVQHYLQRWRLEPVQDPSNLDSRYRRNALRLHVLPALRQHIPEAERSLLQAARRAALESDALGELAQADLAACMDPPTQALRLQAWQGLSDARRALVLRAWFGVLGQGAPPHTLIERLLHELPGRHGAGSGRWPAPQGWVAVHRGLLHHLAELPANADEARPAPPARLSINAPGDWEVPGHCGRLLVRASHDGGLPLHCLSTCEARSRQGGEQFQAATGGVPRSLKKQYQQAGVPSWAREGPLLWQGTQLLFVPGLGVDARVRVAPGQPSVRLRWQPDHEAVLGDTGPPRAGR